jgi:hypothetical protein
MRQSARYALQIIDRAEDFKIEERTLTKNFSDIVASNEPSARDAQSQGAKQRRTKPSTETNIMPANNWIIVDKK